MKFSFFIHYLVLFREEIAIPFTEFSNDWSSYTGEPITKCVDDPSVCPSDKNLQDISQVSFKIYDIFSIVITNVFQFLDWFLDGRR
jgi:hypothetical protein